MKRNKVLKTVAIVLAAVLILLVIAALGVFFYLRHLMSSLPETLPDADDDTLAQVTLTDEELDQLLSGEITLDELSSAIKSEEAASEEASASAAESASAGAASNDTAAETNGKPEAASSSSSQNTSGNASGSSSGNSSSSTGTSGTGSSGHPAASTKTEQAYETEVKALLKQLYAVKARAEAELNSCIAGAKASYKALPESQQTQARKVSIALSYSSKLYAMQASYDKEVDNIVSQMRSILVANGQSTELADQALASYKAQKSATYSQLMAKLYS